MGHSPFFQSLTGHFKSLGSSLSKKDKLLLQLINFMKQYFAFLRAINVGSHTVKMENLKALFEKINFKNVQTFIASGNVIFETEEINLEEIKSKIEEKLKKFLGYDVAAFIRTKEELKKVLDKIPFKKSGTEAQQNNLYIAFLEKQPTKKNKEELDRINGMSNEFYISKNNMYWLCKKNFSDSGINGNKLEKILGVNLTIRNSTTINKLLIKY